MTFDLRVICVLAKFFIVLQNNSLFCYSSFHETFFSLVLQKTVMGIIQNVSQNGQNFICFAFWRNRNQQLRQNPLSVCMKSTAASIFSYCFAKCSHFAVSQNFLWNFCEMFRETEAKRTKLFVQKLLVSLFRETPMQRSSKTKDWPHTYLEKTSSDNSYRK